MTLLTKIVLAVLLSGTLLFGCLRLGVYQDREFNDYYFFVKHKASIHFYFHAPVGESDRRLIDLSESDRQAEVLYREFVEDGGGWQRATYLPI
jgi:hypothetical protein